MRPLSREGTAERIPFQHPEGSQVSGLGAPVDQGGDGRALGGSLHTSLQRPTAWLVLELSHTIPALGLVSGEPLPRVRQPALAGDSSQPASRVLSARGLGRVVGTLLTHPRSLWVRTRGPPSFSRRPHTHRLGDAEADAGHPRDEALKATGRGLRKLGAGCRVQPSGHQRIFSGLGVSQDIPQGGAQPSLYLREQDLVQKQRFSSRDFTIDLFWKIFSRPLPVGTCVRVCACCTRPGLVLNLLLL